MQLLLALPQLPHPPVSCHHECSTVTSNQEFVAYEAPRPSGVPGASFGFGSTISSGNAAEGGFFGGTAGPGFGGAGGTFVYGPSVDAASGMGAIGYNGLSGVIDGSAGKAGATMGAVGCAGGAYQSLGTTVCLGARNAEPTA